MAPVPKLDHFLFCRSARADAHGDVEIAGLVVGPIYLHGPGHLDQLTVFVALSGMSQVDRFKPRVTIVPPSGETRSRQHDWRAHPVGNECHIYSLVIGEFEIPDEGRYVVRLDLEFDGDLRTGYSRAFEVRFDGAAETSSPK